MLANQSLSSLHYRRIIDIQGKVYGNIKDALLHSDNLELYGLVIFGNKVEELMEKFNFKKNKDPVIQINHIEKITNDAIFLNIGFEELQNLYDINEYKNGKLFLFSNLKKLPIYDLNANDIGRIKNIVFANNTTIELVLGSSSFYDLLDRNRCSKELLYTITLDDLVISNNDIRVRISARELENRIKLSMGNIIRDMRIRAIENGNISDDEQSIIDIVEKDINNYYKKYNLFQLGGIKIDEFSELENHKSLIFNNILTQAKLDSIITDDERSLLLLFANHFHEPQSILGLL